MKIRLTSAWAFVRLVEAYERHPGVEWPEVSMPGGTVYRDAWVADTARLVEAGADVVLAVRLGEDGVRFERIVPAAMMTDEEALGVMRKLINYGF